MNPPWFLVSRKGAKTPGNSAPVARSRFIPRLEALEDRSLLSVVPVVTFIDETIGQPVANQSSSPAISPQPTTFSTYDLNVTVSIAYCGSTISFVSYSFSSSVNGLTINVPTSNGVQSTLVSGNTNYVTIQTGNQTPSTGLSWIQFQLTLSSIPTGTVASSAGYSLLLSASDSGGDATLQFTLTGSAASGSVFAGAARLTQWNTPTTTNAGSLQPDAETGSPSTSSAWYFSNSGGPSTLAVRLANLSFASQENSGASQKDTVAFVFGTRFLLVSDMVCGSGNYVSLSAGNYPQSVATSGQSAVSPKSIINLNSLVAAQTTPGLYLTFSITQEISQRSWSGSAQATWTGLRPPLEAPLASPGSTSIKLGFWSGRAEMNSIPGTISGLQLAENNSHAMEKMVAKILVSLQMTEADHQAKDIAQANEQRATDPESQTSDIFFAALGLEPRAGSNLLGNPDDSLNQLLEGMALTDAVPLTSEMHQPEQENDAANASTKATVGWGWRVLGECMATVLLALYWPGVIWPQASTRKESNAYRPKLSDPF